MKGKSDYTPRGGPPQRKPDGKVTSVDRFIELWNLKADWADDEAMAELGMSEEEFVEPLTRFEFQIASVAVYVRRKGAAGFDYGDVIRLTARFSQKPINGATIYKTMVKLEERGILKALPAGEGTDATRHFYALTELGMAAFHATLANAKVLARAKAEKATMKKPALEDA